MALIFDVKVTPNSSKKGWSMDKLGNLKCYVKNPAQEGKANAEIIKTLSKMLRLPQDMITIVAGEHAKNKKIKIDIDINFNQLIQMLGIDWQMDMFS
jgi:uncharacterized protein